MSNDVLKKTGSRFLWLDVMKAFGILLVVLNHIEGVSIPLVTFFGGMVYMPLFFVAAGYTYRRKEERYADFLKEKAKRLLVPYFVCNLFLFAFFTLKNHEFSKPALLGIFYSRTMLMKPGSAWNMPLMPYLNAPTWFLTCLFLCYALYGLLDRKFTEPNKRRTAVAAVTAAGIALHYLSPALLPWSLENVCYFQALLELGRYVREEGEEWLGKNRWIYANFLMVFVLLSYLNGTVNVSVGQYGHSMLLYLAVGATGTLLMMAAAKFTERYVKPLAKPLAWLGRHTLPVLCWHLFAIEILKSLWSIF